MSKSTATTITLINCADGSVEAHRTGCADILRGRRSAHDEVLAPEAWDTKRECFLDYNADFIAEADGDESNTYQINWKPCTDFLPEA